MNKRPIIAGNFGKRLANLSEGSKHKQNLLARENISSNGK